MQKHWLHPLNLLVVIAIAVSMVIWSLELFFSVGNVFQKLNHSCLADEGWNWAHIISAVIWIIGFSGGVVGAVVNISHAIRLRSSKVTNFSEMKHLEKREVQGLNLWLDSSTYGSEHLRELWGEDSNESH